MEAVGKMIQNGRLTALLVRFEMISQFLVYSHFSRADIFVQVRWATSDTLSWQTNLRDYEELPQHAQIAHINSIDVRPVCFFYISYQHCDKYYKHCEQKLTLFCSA